jgi:hypothetical protein
VPKRSGSAFRMSPAGFPRGHLGQSEGNGYQDSDNGVIIKWRAKVHATTMFLRPLNPFAPF